MIDLQPGQLLSLAEASKLLPGKPHVSTLHRWRLRGIRGVKLPTLMVGGRRFVLRAALEEFIARTTAARATESASPPSTPSRMKAMAQAEKSLQGLGLNSH